MRNLVRRHRSLTVGVILLVALAVRIAQIQRSSFRPINDAGTYLKLGSQVAHSGDYSTSSNPGNGSGGTRGPSALFPPGLPFLLAGVDLLDGHTTPRGPSVHPALLSQAVLGTAAVALTGLVALEAFGETVALAAIVLAAFYPVMIETSATILAENLFVVLELGAIWAALRMVRASRPYRWAALTGALVGLTALTHENGLVLLVPLGIAAWRATGRSRLGARRLVAPGVVVLVAVLTIAPWTVRNALVLHAFVPISDQAGETVFGTYNSTSADDPRRPYRWLWPARIASAQPLVREASRLREPVFESSLLSRALRYIDAHPLSLVQATFDNTRRLLELDGSLEWKSSAASISITTGTARIGVLSFWAVAILAVVGALTSYARAAPRWLWLAPLVMFLSVIWVRMETPRFREPLEPFFVLLAACTIVVVAARLQGNLPAGLRRRSTVATARGQAVEVNQRTTLPAA